MIDLGQVILGSFKVTIGPILILLSASFATPANAQADTPAAQEAACNAGNSAACTALGQRLTNGVGIAKDEQRGANLFLKACQGENRDALGCALWGYAMDTGRGAYINPAQGAAFYKTACELNNAIGCNNYGRMRRDGRGEVKNEIFALSAFRKSCDLGFANGCVNQGRLNADATTLPPDRALAVQAFDKGCTLGSMDGCNVLAWHLEQGLGTSRDVARAAMLYTKACQGGFQRACTNGQRLTGVSSASPSNAATVGMSYMSCHGFIRANRKIFIAPVIMAASARDDEMARAYAQRLRSDGYAGLTAYDPPGTPLPELTAFCIVEPTREGAERKRQALIRGAGTGPARERMNVVLTSFDPL